MKQQRTDKKRLGFATALVIGALIGFLPGEGISQASLTMPTPGPAAASAQPLSPPAPSPKTAHAPKFNIFPISDEYPSSPYDWENLITPPNAYGKFSNGADGSEQGFGLVSAINNRNEILFRAGDVYVWTGSSLVWEHRAWGTIFPAHYASVMEADPRPNAQPGSVINNLVPVPAAIAPLYAIGLDDNGDVMGTSEGGFYLSQYSPSGSIAPYLLLANSGEKDVDGSTEADLPGDRTFHGRLTGGMNGNGQFVGTVNVVSEDSSKQDQYGRMRIAATPIKNRDGRQIATALSGGGSVDVGHTSDNVSQVSATIFYSSGLYNLAAALPLVEDTDGADAVPAAHTGRMIIVNSQPEVDGLPFHPAGLNNAGDVIGYIGAPNLPTPVVFENGQWTIIPFPHDILWFFPNSINDNGDIVGNAETNTDSLGGYVAALVHNGIVYNLNDCIPSDCPLILDTAVSINDRDEIVGRGHVGSDVTDLQSYLLVPIPKAVPQRIPGNDPSTAQPQTAMNIPEGGLQ